MSLNLNLNYLHNLDKNSLIEAYGSRITEIFNSVRDKTAEGSEVTGWIEWVNRDHSDLINSAVDLREFWKSKQVQTVVVIGTGGSYIGCKAGVDFSNSFFKANNFQFIFAPYFSERYLSELVEYLEDRKFAILVISKSGTTLESAVAFRILRELLYKKEGEDYSKFIAAITDKEKGVLRNLVNNLGIRSFTIEDDIGGRYSTLTAVGIVPMVLAGVNVDKVLDGAKKAYKDNFHGDLNSNFSALYACVRNYLFEKRGLVSECFSAYDPHLRFCLEKAKQLFSESEGKNGKGIMPIVFDFTPDLHSVGQLLQDGHKSFFETILMVNKPKYELIINKSKFGNDDQLDWLAEKTLKDINNSAYKGTLEAHFNNANINHVVIELDSWSEENFGYYYYWLSMSAMFSSYLFGVNPFNQPGVEIYKKRMFELLGKF